MKPLAAILLLACIVTLSPRWAGGAQVVDRHEACILLEKRVAHVDRLPISGPPGMGWYCDFSTLGDASWYVIALRSNRKCPGICSNLMGWFAVSRKNGSVHEYDMANLQVGAAVKDRH